MTTINPEKLRLLDDLYLHDGAHDDFDDGHCAMEVVSWLADEGFTDAPHCASPIVRRYTIALNDRWDDTKRQQLKPYLVRMIGTGSDGLEAARERVLPQWTGRLLSPWLRMAGLDAEANRIEAATSADDLRAAVNDASSAAWRARGAARERLAARVREQLGDKPAAAADAVAAAAAAADADAAAVAVAVAAAVADAVAAAVADAAVSPASQWGAAYRAARAYYEKHPLPIAEQVADLAREQESVALELLGALIDPEAVSS